MQENRITEKIIAAAMNVHTGLGPGLLESAYQACLVHELRKEGLRVEQQKELPVRYDGLSIDCGYRLDLLVEDQIGSSSERWSAFCLFTTPRR
jgi:GxxExxY protein